MEIDFLITSFVALFVIIDPIGLTPLFVALTQGMSAKARRNITIRAIGVAFLGALPDKQQQLIQSGLRSAL